MKNVFLATIVALAVTILSAPTVDAGWRSRRSQGCSTCTQATTATKATVTTTETTTTATTTASTVEAKAQTGSTCELCERAHPVANAARGVASAIVDLGANFKSRTQAAARRMYHVGGLPAGCYEGVGRSSVSAEHALSVCCYSRSGMKVVDQSVVQGADGYWYATRIYRR